MTVSVLMGSLVATSRLRRRIIKGPSSACAANRIDWFTELRFKSNPKSNGVLSVNTCGYRKLSNAHSYTHR